jgi:hypothetical protein
MVNESDISEAIYTKFHTLSIHLAQSSLVVVVFNTCHAGVGLDGFVTSII